ncbi:hypothetical protein NE236_01490 [Actinoallomurus purpureus]|uniref:hypothetical protein n=1 Tax=Actinoallomurus purpureus TaxID=478114 RepID=UPI0020932734|nr:hypothetical protein [Actinoallomurus purpureus]MCO6003640.1 hypothetical protein [Actinoallomurus purpureus]
MRQSTWTVFFLLLGGSVAGLSGCSSASPAEQDAWRVFCLSPAERPELANAAVTLGLAAPASAPGLLRVKGQEVTPERWREGHREDFDQACTALVRSPAGGHATDSANPLISIAANIVSLVVGGLLTLAGGIVQSRRTESRQRAENLRSAAHEYGRAGRAYLDAWVEPGGRGRPAGRDVTERRDDLDAELRKCQSVRPGWTLVRHLRDELRKVTGDLLGEPGPDLDRHVTRMRQRVSDLENNVERVAEALEHPLQRHRTMRRPGGTS